jgi:hypothetical protein
LLKENPATSITEKSAPWRETLARGSKSHARF